MALPILFTETQRLTPEARAQIRPLLTLYKQYRHAITSGYVMPLGKTPSDKSWAGFQSYDPDSQSGHIMLFRELNNPEPMVSLPLHFAKGRNIELKPIWTSDNMNAKTNQDIIIATSKKSAVAGWFEYQFK